MSRLEDKHNIEKVIKVLRNPGAEPSVPSSEYKTDGTWINTDIYKGQFAVNIEDGKVWYRDNSGITEIGGSSGDGNFVHITGDTMTGDLYVFADVGIGTNTPSAPLEVKSTTSSEAKIRINDQSGQAGSTYGIDFHNDNIDFNVASIYCNYGSGYGNSKLLVYVADSSQTPQERMRIDVDGNIGIGTTSPSYTLDVDGNAGVSSLSAANERIITTSGTSELQNYLETESLLIVDSILISGLINPSNWTGGTYLGTTTNAIEGQYYVGQYYKYEFDNTTFKRYEFTYPPTEYTTDTTGATSIKDLYINSTGDTTIYIPEANTMVFNEIHITNIGSGTSTIIPITSTIAGETTQTINQYDSMHLKIYKNNYYIV